MCDTLVLVEPGRVFFAKNSDRDPNEPQLLDWQPARSHSNGATVRCTWIEIEQIRETHAVLLSRPYWMWGAEMGTNEHGVTIGNEAVFTDERYAMVGLTGMDLLRLALERAATASEGIETIVALLEHHGQGGGCGHERRGATYHNSFIVADATGAYVLETAGAKWAVEQVTDGARSISNGLTIPEFVDHADWLHTRFSRCARRRAITEAGARATAHVGDLMAVLRDHGTGDAVPRYALTTGAMAAPCMHAGGTVAAAQTTGSWVAELRPSDAAHWVTATAAPCTGLFKPVRVDEPLDLGPATTDRFDARCLWWRHELLHRRVLTDPAHLAERFTSERDEIEARWIADPPAPADAFTEADRLLADWTRRVGTGPLRDTRPVWARRYWNTRNRRAGISLASSAAKVVTP